MSNIILKPCPICKSNNINIYEKEINGQIGCVNCGYTLREYPLEILIKIWNEKSNEQNDNKNKKQPKPPLGIMPKHIYELQRVQDICRALQEYSCYENSIHNYELMIEWSEELVERLSNLKYELEYENK